MKAKYVSETYIDTRLPTKAYDENGWLIVGKLSDDILESLDYHDVVESEYEEPEEGYHMERRYELGEQDEKTVIVQTWVQVKDPDPEPRRFNKYKILEQVEKFGLVEQFLALIKANDWIYEKWSAAKTLDEGNPAFATTVDSIIQNFGLTKEQVDAALAECVD